MNENHQSSEELLEYAFGELSADRQREVRDAIEKDSELAASVRGLEAAAAAVLAENRGQVSEAFNDRLRERMSEILNGESGQEATHDSKDAMPSTQPALTLALSERERGDSFSRTLTTWRWMMRSRISRVAAAMILVMGIGGFVFWIHGPGATPAYADFFKPIREAKTARYKMTTETTGASAGTTTTVVMMLGPSRSRSEMEIEMPNYPKSKLVQIWDGYQGKRLHLDPKVKQATIHDYVDMPKDQMPKDADPLGMWRSFLLDAKEVPDLKREPLGEREIDGRHVIGYRITSPTAVIDAWGDPKTRMPVCFHMTTPMVPNMKATMSDFELNVDLDESLFSIEPPAGYTVTTIKSPKTDESPAGEKDLIETFRYFGELSGGTFPDFLDHETLIEMVYGGLWMYYSLDQSSTSNEKHQVEHYAAQVKFDRGLKFAILMPKESDMHYAGKGISLGTADAPVFWYRPKDAKKYRVIYADLSVREADTPPDMPIVQPGQPEKELIEMLREYGEWSGGTLPDALTEVELDMVFMEKNILADVPEKQDKRLSEQWKKIAAARVKVPRGMKFIKCLPKEADWHYAGKRVSIGAADMPIFWYRPKDAKTYRVVYADLTVRDADTAPKASYVLPEQDLIDMFREYGKMTGGKLPKSLDMMKMMEGYSRKMVREMFLDMATPVNGKLHEEKRRKIEVLLQNLTVLQEYDPEKKPDEEQTAKFKELSRKCDAEFDKLVDWDKVAPGKKNLTEKEKNHYKDAYTQKFMPRYIPEILKATKQIQPGLTFVSNLPPEADAHYAGKGIKLDAADTPIFWYRPKDAKTYRVVYADLTVRDAGTAPEAPDTLPEQDLIDMFRIYGNLIGGELPDALDLKIMLDRKSRKIVADMYLDMATPVNGKLDEEKRRKIEEIVQNPTVLQEYDPENEKPNEEQTAKLKEQSRKLVEELINLVDWEKVAPGEKNLSEEQKKKFMEAYMLKNMDPNMPTIREVTMEIQPGLTFVSNLPPEADVHYAGKGVLIGAVDKPIFWYRPKDGKKYRVIYADMTVREAEEKPKVEEKTR